MIVFETCHHIKRKRQGQHGLVAMKTDMSESYDRVEWKFLGQIMQKLGFDDRWTRLIIQRVHSVSYLVLHNGTESDSFRPARGLRQDDHLSPFLFILCANGLLLPGIFKTGASSMGAALLGKPPPHPTSSSQTIATSFSELAPTNAPI